MQSNASSYQRAPQPYTPSNQPKSYTWAKLTERFNGFSGNVTSGEKFEKAGHINYRARKVAAMLADWDIRDMEKFFSRRLEIPKNPIGMLIFLILPCVISSRALRAVQRDKTGTELRDVLRRDVFAITLFLFMLPPVVNAINWAKQSRDGLNLVHKADRRDILPKAYSYGELANSFDINNIHKLEVLVSEGNGKGVHKSAEKTLSMYRNLLKDIDGGDTVLSHWENFTHKAHLMAEEGKKLGGTIDVPKSNDTLKNLSKKAFADLTKAQEAFNKISTRIGADTSKAGSTIASTFNKNKKNIPAFAESLVHYAKGKRLPADITSIALTAVAIGWGPVAFNDYLSQKRLKHIQAHPEHNAQQGNNPFRQTNLQTVSTQVPVKSDYAVSA